MAVNVSQQAKQAENKIKNMLSRGTVKGVTSNTGTQSLQLDLFADEARDNLEYPQEYGFTSAPLAGAEAIAGFFGGNRDHGTVIKVFDKRYRPKTLAAGEVCIYDHLGTKITLKQGNVIELECSTEIKLIAPKVTITGDLEVQGDITDNHGSNTRTVSGMRSVYNGHTHPENGSTTSAPSQGM